MALLLCFLPRQTPNSSSALGRRLLLAGYAGLYLIVIRDTPVLGLVRHLAAFLKISFHIYFGCQFSQHMLGPAPGNSDAMTHIDHIDSDLHQSGWPSISRIPTSLLVSLCYLHCMCLGEKTVWHKTSSQHTLGTRGSKQLLSNTSGRTTVSLRTHGSKMLQYNASLTLRASACIPDLQCS